MFNSLLKRCNAHAQQIQYTLKKYKPHLLIQKRTID